jgi:hypothetical protein
MSNIATNAKHILYTSSDCYKKEKPNMRKCSVLQEEQEEAAPSNATNQGIRPA